MSRQLVMGNWKLNGSVALLQTMSQALSGAEYAAEVTVLPPCTLLLEASRQAQGFFVGAQDVSSHASGAYTGEVSAVQLAEVGCKYVLVGHSERRQYHGEAGNMLLEKMRRASEAGLVPVLCVGENLAQREAGEAEKVVTQQLSGLDSFLSSGLVVAYEPVWAIGTGKVASIGQIAEMHDMMRAKLGSTVPLLYGGSVKAANAAEILSLGNVDGVLVGGASLVFEEFDQICRAAVRV